MVWCLNSDYTVTYVILRETDILLQSLNRQCSCEVGRSETRWFLRKWQMRLITAMMRYAWYLATWLPYYSSGLGGYINQGKYCSANLGILKHMFDERYFSSQCCYHSYIVYLLSYHLQLFTNKPIYWEQRKPHFYACCCCILMVKCRCFLIRFQKSIFVKWHHSIMSCNGI